MPYYADRVEETTTTTGTGDITLAGATTQNQSFNTAFGTGKRFKYVLVDADGTDWETGIGYLSASTTLVRETVEASTNSGSAINLSSGTHTIFHDFTAGSATAAGMGNMVAMASGMALL